MPEGLSPRADAENHRAVLSLQRGEDGRLRLLPRPPPPASPIEDVQPAAAEVNQPIAAVPVAASRGQPQLSDDPSPRRWLRRRPRVVERIEEPVVVEIPLEERAPEPPPIRFTAPVRLIEFQSVTVRYGKERALSDFSLSIDSGELIALVGASGAGKTTALRLLQGLVKPTAGRLFVDGVPVHRTWAFRIRRLRRRIGVVFQDYRLLDNRSALENVAFALQVSDLSVPRAEARRRAAEQLALVGLAGREKARPDQLSGGQQQRLAIARSLVTRPRILLADEPTASLDAAQARNVLDLFKKISDSGTAVVLATHDRGLLNGSGVRTVRLSKGRLISDKPKRGKLWVIQ